MPVTPEQLQEKLQHIDTARAASVQYLDAAKEDAKKGNLDLLKVLALQRALQDEVNAIVALDELTKDLPA